MSISFCSLVFPKLLHPPQQLTIGTLPGLAVSCQSSQSPESRPAAGSGHNELQIGSPIILIAAPPTLKTASSMPSLRVNSGEVKPGDVGRIVSRKPKDVWAVRLAIGTYLIDGKHFKPLDLEE